ncbi:hypothetical protein [Bacillus sp. CECT 9360]|uniref:hypothetical protein n=1 Tax=Bacillus sp. CECT 9360 TaxID=2845821 RepID=UPI001E5E9708|nr:hypothetical protein [Bacillus sp. CECT 9360]CAH0345754.1 hypothetical protein BCI9360_02052 [Bacillus sp. CECT 9360]
MNDLKSGLLDIAGVLINPNSKLSDIKSKLPLDKVNIIKVDQENESIRLLGPVEIGNKDFYVVLAFFNKGIRRIELRTADPTIDEWDYKSMLAQHGDWLVEQIGHPEGILDENIFQWGKIIQWDDPRAHDAGIKILYFQHQ